MKMLILLVNFIILFSRIFPLEFQRLFFPTVATYSNTIVIAVPQPASVCAVLPGRHFETAFFPYKKVFKILFHNIISVLFQNVYHL